MTDPDALPFPVAVHPWGDPAGPAHGFIRFADDNPLHPRHAARVGVLAPADAGRLADWAFAAIPPGWPDRTDGRFPDEAEVSTRGCWTDAGRRAGVRRWLYGRGVPFGRTAYLVYDRPLVVRAPWRLVIRHWDAFAWSVGYGMVAVNHTRRWACCFHHEEMIVFGRHEGFA